MPIPKRSSSRCSTAVVSRGLATSNHLPILGDTTQLIVLLDRLRSLCKDLEAVSLQLKASDVVIPALQAQIIAIQRKVLQTATSTCQAPSQNALSGEEDGLREILLDVRNELSRRDQELCESIHDFQIILTAVFPQIAPELTRQLAYRSLIRRIREVTKGTFKRDTIVVVVSKGDNELLSLGSCHGWHFPQDPEGAYAGHYPLDSAEAIVHLEELRTKGADFLLVPQTSLWWLEHYTAFRCHLERTSRLVHRSDDCWIFSLRQPSPWKPLTELISELKDRFGRNPAILNWECSAELARVFSECPVFDPIESRSNTLPYCEESIDIVAVRSGDANRLAEARRVASEAVLMIAQPAGLQSVEAVNIERRRNHVSNCRTKNPTPSDSPPPNIR